MRRITLITNPDKCNLRCPLCFLNQRGLAFGMGEMPIEVAIASIEKVANKSTESLEGGSCLREVVPSTMGEPLLYSKFRTLLDFCKSRGIPLNLTTNGTFPGQWGTETGMSCLLGICSDIKVSCMGWKDSFDEMMPGFAFETWKDNVMRLIWCRSQLKGRRNVATVSLQVTLHKKNFIYATEILRWAESVGVDRVKWNLPVFLSVAPVNLKERYGLNDEQICVLQKNLVSDKVSCEGSLFFSKRVSAVQARDKMICPFVDELWVLPDGSFERCPNPERRFGNKNSEWARCEFCPMK